MRYTFFDSTSEALTKFAFCLLTYCSSILLVQFLVPQILPVIFIFVLSNLFDYIDIALCKREKHFIIRVISFILTLYWIGYLVFIYTAMTSADAKLLSFISQLAMLFYGMTAPLVVVPFVDTIIGYALSLYSESRRYKDSIIEGASYQDIKDYVFQLQQRVVDEKT